MISHYLKNKQKAFLTGTDNLVCYLFDKSPSRGPLFVNWDITTKCHSKCIFCDRWKAGGTELSTEKKLDIIRKLGKSGIWLLSLCGGDPLLTKDLDVILAEIKKQGMLINISTNGHLLGNKSKLMIESGVDFVTVSIQSHSPEIHDYISGSKGLFERIEMGIKKIRRLRKNKTPRIYARIVLNKLTFPDLEDFLKYWRPKVDGVILQPISKEPKMLFKIPENMKFSKKSRRYFNDFYRLLKLYDIENLYNKMIPNYIFEKSELKNKVKCFAGYFFLTLDAKGNVYSCSSRKKKVGNLKNEDFSQILNSRNMKNLRNSVKSGKNRCFCWHSGSMLNVYLSKVLKL